MANLDFKTLEFLTSLTFNFKTVSDTVTSSYSVSSPVASGDRVAADLDLINGGCFRWRMVSHRESSRYSVKVHGINRNGYDTDEDDFDYYDDLDDDYELVKIQRIRKSGKRTFAKNVTSSKKRASYSQLKSGCVHGKHGLCIKFRC
ncbi:hypothetical protein ISN45_Aa08g010120 [Arabidopsis thaliana x Arabidopsis arenosa]|uniref:Uncharacterized protein n=1 Tax=Arabidopsis thaliana x Arabidopsis arenosa TaxID=1240361 RepID=A0A8T1XFR0_9BRAS|nr:hypothetical protein ISN45_Aa08g010120 [Arabidopsis thaliana x Arabidopsis arenosa]